jgi:hypothetical protein
MKRTLIEPLVPLAGLEAPILAMQIWLPIVGLPLKNAKN